MSQNAVSWLQSNFTYRGRISRGPYIVISLIYWFFQFFPIPTSSPEVDVILFILFLPFFIFAVFQTIRRLHDINCSGWWWPIKIITIIIPLGLILDLVLCVTDGTPGKNQYGEDPLGRASVSSETNEEMNKDGDEAANLENESGIFEADEECLQEDEECLQNEDEKCLQKDEECLQDDEDLEKKGE